MTPRSRDGLGNDDGLDSAGPMADVILGTTGILLVLLVALGPAVLSRQVRAVTPSIEALPPGFAVEDHAGPVLFAVAEGLAVEPGWTVIPVSEIATTPLLAALGAARLLLIVQPDGIEAAFHASARLAAVGVREVDRVRVDQTCADILRVERQGSMLMLVCQRR